MQRRSEEQVGAVRAVAHESPGCVSVPLFSDDFTKALLEHVTKLANSDKKLAAQLDSLEGLRLDPLPGFRDFARDLTGALDRLLRYQSKRLVFENAFVIRYTAGSKTAADMDGYLEPIEQDMPFFMPRPLPRKMKESKDAKEGPKGHFEVISFSLFGSSGFTDLCCRSTLIYRI